MLKDTQQNRTSLNVSTSPYLSSTLSIASHFKLACVMNKFLWPYWHWILLLRSLIFSLLVVLFWENWILSLVFLSFSFSSSQTLYILSLRHVFPWHSLLENFLHCWDLVLSSQTITHACLVQPFYLQHLAGYPVYRLHPKHKYWINQWICLFICFYGKVMMWKQYLKVGQFSDLGAQPRAFPSTW